VTTYVLVHGAWSGAHTWRKVRPLLWQQGHAVFTPALTGIGERSHLASAQVRLSTHVEDVVNCVRYEDLTDVVLLGFSYGGLVVAGALADLADRVRRLVFLDAFVPQDGDSALTLLGIPAPDQALGAPWQVPARPRVLADPAEQAWSDARRTPQPLATFTEPVLLSRPVEDYGLDLTYVKATSEPTEAQDSAFWRAARHAHESPAWAYHEIDCHHQVPLTRPQQLADILLDL
jgi:pimeloyl-ACP methyl ester carboxylesterase